MTGVFIRRVDWDMEMSIQGRPCEETQGEQPSGARERLKREPSGDTNPVDTLS